MSKLKEMDLRYQDSVDDIARQTLHLKYEELLNYEDYGSIDKRGINIAFWHYTLSNGTHHIIFLSERKLIKFLPLYRKYVSGVVLRSNDEPRLMTDDECWEYY